MSYQTISILKSLIFIVMFVLPSHLLLPKALKFWQQWKETGKVSHLSNALASVMLIVFFYIGALVIAIMRLTGMA
jgi:chromate transport protein ChrA